MDFPHKRLPDALVLIASVSQKIKGLQAAKKCLYKFNAFFDCIFSRLLHITISMSDQARRPTCAAFAFWMISLAREHILGNHKNPNKKKYYGSEMIKTEDTVCIPQSKFM